MQENDRKFSFYEIDLNDDGRKEFFVSLAGSYFCGSGGCSFYLLNDDLTINTYFSVTNPPIFVSSHLTNGLHDLIFKGNYDKDGGGVNFVHLKYSKEKKGYPSNPSVMKKTDVAPGGHDFNIWENSSAGRTFSF